MLRLVEERPGLWERFQRGGELRPWERSPVTRLAGPSVVSRWRRALALGVASDGPAHPVGAAAEDLVVRRETAIGALRRASAVVDALEVEVTSRGLLTLVSDADGVIVRARGGDAFQPEVVKTRLIEGARWDEGSRGTNAIGTAIAERCAVAVIGRAHFEAVNHGLFCYAAPVFDAFGDLMTVLDVSGPLALDHHAVGAAVSRAASEIEESIRAEAYAATGPGTRRLIERMVERTATPAILFEPPGVIRRLNEAAAVELELDRAATVERVFGVSWQELTREAASGRAVFETARRTFDVEFEAIVGADGRALGIVCLLSPVASRGRARRTSSPPTTLPVAFDAIFASDPAVVDAKRSAARLAASDVPVLLLAETGTGKELFARAVHASSRRADGPLVAINCGALSGTLLESELFGYAPGAFTGASKGGAEGKLAAAHGGTLFLDEVAEMSQAAQAMLLRFLDDGSYCRVGDVTALRADVRVVCATCRDLPARVADGSFRSDLFYRIHGGCLKIPPLRDRTDKLPLAQTLLASAAKAAGVARPPDLSASAEAWILDHGWPGNVRELKTALQHALAMSESRELRQEDFPEPLVALMPPTAQAGTRDKALRGMAEAALQRAHGNVSEAARALGVARSTIYRMLAGAGPKAGKPRSRA